jgi:uncharacterized membrane protein YkvA (DUF1232 family)
LKIGNSSPRKSSSLSLQNLTDSAFWSVVSVIYFVSPIDFLPEVFLGPLGLIDDILVFLIPIHKVITILWDVFFPAKLPAASAKKNN